MTELFDTLGEILRPETQLQEDKLLIRASQLGLLMTEPKTKADKEAGLLSETAKTMVESIWLYNKYGYKESVVTDEMMKGLICEQDSMALVQEVLGGEFRVKNDERKQNDYVIGSADTPLKKEDVIEDLKSSYNLRTFFNAKYKQGDVYWWQGQAYMWLWGKKKYRLIYCLVPTPEEYITEQKKKFWYKFNCDETNEDYIKISMQIDRNNELIKDIPAKDRVKVFEFGFDADAIEQVKVQYDKAVKYYNTLKL
jgi:hypothetical protein